MVTYVIGITECQSASHHREIYKTSSYWQSSFLFPCFSLNYVLNGLESTYGGAILATGFFYNTRSKSFVVLWRTLMYRSQGSNPFYSFP